MRAQEFLVEYSENGFVDGTLKITQHVKQRSQTRNIAMADIMQALKRLEIMRGQDLRDLPPTSFVVKTPYGFELAMVKSQSLTSKKIEYIVTTVRSRLKIAAGQRVVYLEDGTVQSANLNGLELQAHEVDDSIEVTAYAQGRALGRVLFVKDGQTLMPQDLLVDERYRGQGIAQTMYDWTKSLGYQIRRSNQQTDDGAKFWQKNRPGQNVWEAQTRLPRAIEEFLDSLNPDDCGVEDIGAYRIHFEGFTSDCKSSADYRRDPEAVYQQVYADFIQREGGQRPLVQDMTGDEDFPILYSIFRRRKTIAENTTATAQQVLAYINRTHHEPFQPGEKMHAAVMAHPRWQLQRVPLLNLYIPDQEYDDVDYDDEEPAADPYSRVMTVDPAHAGEISQNLVDQYPIVIDSDRYIIDGNHRAWAAKYLLNRDYINAWVPV